MADHVDEVNMNDAMFPTNTISVKEEQCEEDSFIEDKVCISETTITTDNAGLQDIIRHGKLKQYEESTCLNNIKTEVASLEGTEVQNDDFKIGGGFNPDHIKIEFDNGLLYCEHCEAYYEDYCIECGMLVNILNKNAPNSADKGARKDIPNDILEIQDCFGQTGIYALRIIPTGVKFGPFTGLIVTEWPWEMKGDGKFVLDKNKSKYLNWMQYVNPTKNTFDGNLHVFQFEDDIYYQSTRQIQAGEELLVYFGDIRVDFVTTMKDIGKDIFACTFCCLGFSSKSHLAKHKTVCIENIAGKFSSEELTQCPFCKIHLDLKEYFEHHMAFCCQRNARKSILPIPPAPKATTAVNERKRCLRQIYKCEQCKYRTRYQAELKKHMKEHYQVKIYKCGICNRRFKTKESLRVHVENTHAYVAGNDYQGHSTTGYRNTHVKVEQWTIPDQKKIFKCSLCVFQATYKESVRRHIKTEHLKKFLFKCESCVYRTNNKSHLKVHIKTKHLKEFYYKCHSCEYETNDKGNLERHIKTNHSKEFDYKCCHSCEYETNNTGNLECHIKTKHFKEFYYKCDSCEFRTNVKYRLKRHIKSKHLKEFDYKCHSCEYETNHKGNLERHIKTNHSKEFDYKCHSCEYETNNKCDLERHIKTKHLKEFDYKCHSCEFRTNFKVFLERHVKTKHLKKFDYKCDECEFVTNRKDYLAKHIKTKHLKKFDYKCHSCEFRTNFKFRLELHIKTKHLKEFDYICNLCEFRTNIKWHFKRHIKNKHLKIFDYKCDL